MDTIKIYHPKIGLSVETESKIRRAFSNALDSIALSIREAHVTLIDVNGPKGGKDKVCKVQLRLYPRGLAVLKSEGSTVLEAVNLACQKARTVAIKRVNKTKKYKKEKQILN